MTKIVSIKSLFMAMLLTVSTTGIFAQAPSATPVLDVHYTMNAFDGTNASAVVYVAGKELYVTVIAGNNDFPIEGFRADGKNVFSTSAGFDYRGLWYNPKTKKMEGNGAGEAGWVTFGFDSGTGVQTSTSILSGQNQPDFQSVGTFDYRKKAVVFLNADKDKIVAYSRKKPSKSSSISLSWGSISKENINPYVLGYTGVNGYEFVCLDYVNAKLVFFNRSGDQTATVKMPASAPMNDSFACSFTNNRAFFYNKDNRTWYGYRIF